METHQRVIGLQGIAYSFFSKVTGVNHKIKFPAPRAHTLTLRLASPMSKPGLGIPIGHSPGVISSPVRRGRLPIIFDEQDSLVD